MDSKNIQDEIEFLERELRNLKSPQGAIAEFSSYYAEIDNVNSDIVIHYKQDIKNSPITTVEIQDAATFIYTLVGRYNSQNKTQKIFVRNSHPKLSVYSTAPIDYLERVS